MMVGRYDVSAEVLVIGGGLTGLSLSCALSGVGVATVCADSSSPEWQLSDDFDPRTTAIAYASKLLLTRIGVWPLLQPHAEAILSIRVADADSRWFVHYDHHAVGPEPMGWVVENVRLRSALLQRLAQCPCFTHLTSARATELERLKDSIRVRLADGRVVRTKLLVGAEGRDSLTRRWSKIRVLRWPYHQSAIVCNIGHRYPHQRVAVERFLPAGPFAVLPMTGQRSSVIWSERETRAPIYLALAEQEFCSELQRRAGDHLGAIWVVGRRSCYPLSFQLATSQISERLALVGEAAHAIHPVAGQGFNMGLRDIAALSESIVDTQRLGGDIGSTATLERFQRWRRFDNALLSGVCDGLVHLFSNDSPPLRLMRRLGLALTEHNPPAKNFLMRYAMGLTGQLPRLLQGRSL